jgi:hypothetical protein
MTDGLGKDSGGQKLMMWIDDTTSQLDFGLPRGIGSETLGATSKVMLALKVGTNTIGSAIGAGDVVTTIGGFYTEAPSAVGQGNAQAVRVSNIGHLLTTPASALLSTDTTSANIHVNSSALLTGIHIVFSDCNSGDSVTIGDGNTLRLQFITDSASKHYHESFTNGLFFGTNIKHTRSIGAQGATSVTIMSTVV